MGSTKFRATCVEITERYGGCTLHEDPKVGYWQKAEVVFEDDVVLVEVDMPDVSEDRQWLLDYAKEVLLARFDQQAIYLKFIRFIEAHTVEVRR